MFRVRVAALGRLGARFSTRRLAVTPLRSLRGLCTGKADGGGSGESTEEPSEPPCDPLQEPSEATADPEALTLRAKEILATKNEAARYSQNQKRAAGVGCAALGAGGAATLPVAREPARFRAPSLSLRDEEDDNTLTPGWDFLARMTRPEV